MRTKLFAIAFFAAFMIFLWPPLWAGPSIDLAVWIVRRGLVREQFAGQLGVAIWVFPFGLAALIAAAYGVAKVIEHDYPPTRP